jgi:ATP-binding cassette subfamily B protein
LSKREFTLANERQYDRSSPLRWIISHILRYWYLPLAMIVTTLIYNWVMSYGSLLVGRAFSWITEDQPVLRTLGTIALTLAGIRAAGGVLNLGRVWSLEWLAQLLERDCRDELYISLLGKSLTFHGRQRVGDIMARATNDVRNINLFASPGISQTFEAIAGILVPIVTIATLRLELIVVPALFVVVLIVTARSYNLRLNPISDALREQFGVLNAGLEEALSGIEVVKAYAQEKQELKRFGDAATKFRDLFVKRGIMQAEYYPLLMFSIAYAAALAHATLIFARNDGFGVGELISFMGLMGLLRMPTFFSLWSFSMMQMGIASAERILDILNTETELDENEAGTRKTIAGEVAFEHVTFGYNPETPVLKDITFHAAPGETIAIVGQTGSGKSTLTRLINRVYDVNAGRVLVDGVDVRDWSLESLRSQISAIEQDIFLFSRPVGENIAFGSGQQASQEEIERCAREAQAEAFINALPEGYKTEIGERGVTLSGGQRQRLAIARAFLANPRILILDDSTSAIDSATEDEIQRAMHRVKAGRTTFLITHRLSQIRWADRILVLRRGELVDQGTHEELVERCDAYRRIFALYEERDRKAAGASAHTPLNPAAQAS